ncbi:MAG TPA: LysR family transcriptional regulator [Longimicrobiaceae bacterium]|nr:LysR family transcriptional regulator [Longimicrobiaceae bacterium]
MTLEIRDLKLVDAVAEHGTLTRAGSALFLTQSALSHQLADLERRLGTPLFVRSGKRMVLTPAGERLRDSAREILPAVARAVDQARSTGAERRAVLRFSTACYTCYHWLPGVLTEFQREFPGVEPRVVASATRGPIPALLKGKLDVAVVSDPPRDRRIALTPLFADELMAVAAPGHPWAGRAFVAAEDFADQHVLLYNVPRAESTLFREVLDPRGVVPRQVSRVELTEAILELVKAGMGVAMLARWAVAPQVAAGLLAAVPITEKGLHRQWHAAVLRRKETPVYLQSFVDLLRRIGEPTARCRTQWYAA